jgi:nitrogen fixation-related uncharacterized protein
VNILNPMIFNNRWLFVHMLGGVIAGKVALMIHMPALIAIGVVLLVALLWEVYEWRIEDQEAIYGSKLNASFDALGDILGAVICCIVVVL